MPGVFFHQITVLVSPDVKCDSKYWSPNSHCMFIATLSHLVSVYLFTIKPFLLNTYDYDIITCLVFFAVISIAVISY